MRRTPNRDARIAIIRLFLSGQNVNHIMFLLGYEYDVDDINATIRDLLRAEVQDQALYFPASNQPGEILKSCGL